MSRLTLILALGNLCWLAGWFWNWAGEPTRPPLDGPTAEQWQQAQRELAALRARVTELQDKPRIVAAPADAAPAPVAAPASSKPGSESPASALRQMVADPGVRQLLQRQQAVEIDGTYYRLFDQLKLSPKELEHFKGLLQKRAQHEADVGLKLLDPALTAQQRDVIVKQASADQGRFLDSIRAFLNDDGDWKRFEQFELTRRERAQFESFGRRLFASSGNHLSVEQEDQIIAAMADLRRDRNSPLGSLLASMAQSPDQMTPANLQRWEQLQREANLAMVSRSADLNAVQRQVLTDFLEQQLQRTLQGLKLGGRLR